MPVVPVRQQARRGVTPWLESVSVSSSSLSLSVAAAFQAPGAEPETLSGSWSLTPSAEVSTHHTVFVVEAPGGHSLWLDPPADAGKLLAHVAWFDLPAGTTDLSAVDIHHLDHFDATPEPMPAPESTGTTAEATGEPVPQRRTMAHILLEHVQTQHVRVSRLEEGVNRILVALGLDPLVQSEPDPAETPSAPNTEGL